MGDGWREPRWLISEGVILLVGGYVALSSAPVADRELLAGGRVAFFGGLALLVAGVITWLRQPPRPDPAERSEDEPSVEES